MTGGGVRNESLEAEDMPLFFATYFLCLAGAGLAIWTVVQLGSSKGIDR